MPIPPGRSVFIILNAVMGLVYIGCGIALLVYKDRFGDITTAVSIMGGASIAYGPVRLYRAWSDYKAAVREQE